MDKMSVSSSGESISRASSEEELFDVEDDDTEPVLEVRGAEPYRYETVVDVAAQRENADADRVVVGAHAGQQNLSENSAGTGLKMKELLLWEPRHVLPAPISGIQAPSVRQLTRPTNPLENVFRRSATTAMP